MSRRSVPDLLEDLLDAIARIGSYTAGMAQADFSSDGKTQDAVIRNLEIIGEVASRLPEEFQASAPQVPWAMMRGLRNRVIHAYFGVDIEIIWNVVERELPLLEAEIRRLAER